MTTDATQADAVTALTGEIVEAIDRHWPAIAGRASAEKNIQGRKAEAFHLAIYAVMRPLWLLSENLTVPMTPEKRGEFLCTEFATVAALAARVVEETEAEATRQ